MDDLLDLNWSASPQAAKQSTPQARQANRTTSSFDFLAKPGTTSRGANYYSSTPTHPSSPAIAPSSVTARLNLPGRASGSGTSTPSTSTPVLPSSADAFSSLLALPSTSGGSSNVAVSLAEKQARMAEENRKQAEHEKQQFEAHGAFWDSLERGGKTASGSKSALPFEDLLQPQGAGPSARQKVHAETPRVDSGRTPLPLPTLPVKTSAISVYDEDDFLTELSSAKFMPTVSQPPQRTQSPAIVVDPWDFNALSSSVNGYDAQPKSGIGTSGMRTPVSDFDFGEGHGDRSEDHILGDLGKPAAARQKLELPVSTMIDGFAQF